MSPKQASLGQGTEKTGEAQMLIVIQVLTAKQQNSPFAEQAPKVVHRRRGNVLKTPQVQALHKAAGAP
jgi:hypothetical protein